MSARSLARRRSVQNQPRGRRRSRPPSVSASTAAWAPGPNMARSASVSGHSAAAAHRCGPEDVGVVGVEDVGLDRLAEQGLGVVDEVGVERVVARDQHAERVAAAASGPAHLLPEGRAGAGEAGEQHGVEPGDVDAELERVGGGQPGEPARRAAPPRARAAPRAGSRRGRPRPGRPGTGRPRRAVGARSGPPSRPRGATARRPGCAAASSTRSVSRSATSLVAERRTGAPFSPTPGTNGGSHRASAARPRGEPSSVTARDVEPGEPSGGGGGLGHGGRGQHEGGVGAVERRDPPEPPQDLGDVGAEDAAVVVALVDHDVAQGPEEARPAGVPGQQRAVQHVGVGEHVLAVVAGPLAHLGRGVAVVGGAAQVGQPVEPSARRVASWSWASALVGAEVEDGGAALPLGPAAGLDRLQRREQVAQRLARGRARGDHDVAARVGEVGRCALVGPGLGHAGRARRPRARGRRATSATASYVRGGARRARGG